jgi:hypothetical protein
MRVGGQLHAPAALPPGKRPGTHCIGSWVVRLRKISPPPGFDSRTVQLVAKSLCRLRYPGSRWFLGAFAKLRNATISFVIYVCLSVRLSSWSNASPTGRIFMRSNMKIRKSVEKIQVSFKSDKNNGYFAQRPMYSYDNISLHSF